MREARERFPVARQKMHMMLARAGKKIGGNTADSLTPYQRAKRDLTTPYAGRDVLLLSMILRDSTGHGR